MSDTQQPLRKKKCLVQNASGFLGGSLSKRLADEGFEVLGTLKSAGDPKPLAVTRVVDTTPESLTAAFLESDLTVLDCLGDIQAAETMLTAIANAGQLDTEKVLVGVSSVMTWARTSPDADNPEAPVTEADYKKRRPHSSYKELLALEKLVTKCKRDGLRTHVVAAGLTYGAGEDLFHPLFKAAWSNSALPLHTVADGSNVRSRAAKCQNRETAWLARAPPITEGLPRASRALLCACQLAGGADDPHRRPVQLRAQAH